MKSYLSNFSSTQLCQKFCGVPGYTGGDWDLIQKRYSKWFLKSNCNNALRRKRMDYLYHFTGSVM